MKAKNAMTASGNTLPDERFQISRQFYVQRFTLIYSCITLTFSIYFSPQDFNAPVALIINLLLFLIGAPYWFRKSGIQEITLNVISQISNALASIWICSFLGPTSHVNLVAIPQFILVLMMFGGKSRFLTYALGTMCILQLSLPLFPFVDTWYKDKRMGEPGLRILRELMDLSILMLSVYQFRVISEAWYEAIGKVRQEKEKLGIESEWRFRLLRILSHDIKEPMVGALQLLRRLRRDAHAGTDGKVINQLENSQMMIREIISNVESYATAHLDFSLPTSPLSPKDAMDRLAPWLKSRLEEYQIQILDDRTQATHTLLVNQDAFIYQVLLNLLSNAVKFSPSGSKIELSSGIDGDEVFWSIRDEGPGFVPSEASESKLTDPNLKASGSGLGIKIAQLLAQKQDLRLTWTAHPAPTPGTEVRIYQKRMAGSGE